jgi:hypothetical protein
MSNPKPSESGTYQGKTIEQKVDSITLKWGTLKGWDIQTDKGMQLLERYVELGASYGAAQRRDTPEQKEIICQLIDCCAGDIYLDWDGKYVSKEEAKEYVRNYGEQS